MAEQVGAGARRPRRSLRIAVRIAVAVALIAVAAVLLTDRLPSPSQVEAALTAADPRWLAAAACAEVVSLGFFARQQRRLLRAFGVSMTLPRAVAVSWSRSAIAIAMPAGTALSAGFAYGQYRHTGASRSVATAVMVLSGLVSLIGLTLLFGVGLAAGPVAALAGSHPLELGLIVLLVMLAFATAFTVAPFVAPRQAWHLPAVLHPRHQPARLAALRDRLAEIGRTARDVPPWQWAPALGAAVANWLGDLACLVLACRAVGLSEVTVAEIAAVYIGVQVVRQVPITPGGIGLIEAALLAGLVAAGANSAGAGAAVLVYRLLSCWLVIPVGALAALALRRGARAIAAVESPTAAGPLAGGTTTALAG